MSTYFHDPKNRESRELLPGITARTFWGEKMLLSLIDLAPNAVIPSHSHPHEQVGSVLAGEFTLTIAEETRLVRQGDIYIVPGNVKHSVVVGDAAARALEAFSPVREEYKY